MTGELNKRQFASLSSNICAICPSCEIKLSVCVTSWTCTLRLLSGHYTEDIGQLGFAMILLKKKHHINTEYD